MNQRLDQKCFACPFSCGVNRLQNLGICQAPNQLEVSHWQIHHWEEPCISGQSENRGSGTIFFNHCNLHCVFCQNYKILQLGYGELISEEGLLKTCLSLKKQGAYNINFVSPTPYSTYLKNFLIKYKNKIDLPIVWNSNGYERTETIKSLVGLVDVWLPDLKYFNDELAQKYSGAKKYFDFASAAILAMRRLSPTDSFSKDNLIEHGLVVRHLILPGQINDSLKILTWIRDYLGPNTHLSLMAQYYPTHQAKKFPEINRRLEATEYKILTDWLGQNRFNNVFVQDLTSADAKFTPDFK